METPFLNNFCLTLIVRLVCLFKIMLQFRPIWKMLSEKYSEDQNNVPRHFFVLQIIQFTKHVG